MGVSGPIITVTRSAFFDPRIPSNLELWLAGFTIPTTTPGAGLSNHWLGAPPLTEPVIANGSPADIMFTSDGDWTPGTGPPWGEAGWSGAVFYDDTAAFESGFFRWVSGASGAVALRDIRATIVDAGTSTPRTITLTGPLTLVLVIGEQYEEGQRLLGGATSAIMAPYEQLDVEIASSTVQVTGSVIETGALTGRVSLIMVTRDDLDVWRCWIDGVLQAGEFTEAGTLELTHLGQTADYSMGGFSNLILYSADHSGYAADFATYFVGEYGASAGLEP